MRVKSYLMLGAASIAIGCASAPQEPRHRFVECLTDPQADAMHCDGVTRPWSEMDGFVCHSLEDHEAYLEGCR